MMKKLSTSLLKRTFIKLTTALNVVAKNVLDFKTTTSPCCLWYMWFHEDFEYTLWTSSCQNIWSVFCLALSHKSAGGMRVQMPPSCLHGSLCLIFMILVSLEYVKKIILYGCMITSKTKINGFFKIFSSLWITFWGPSTRKKFQKTLILAFVAYKLYFFEF